MSREVSRFAPGDEVRICQSQDTFEGKCGKVIQSLMTEHGDFVHLVRTYIEDRMYEETHLEPKVVPARLDSDKSAKPLTEIVGHVENWGQCIGPHSAESYTYRSTERKECIIIHSRSCGKHEEEYFFSTDHCQGVAGHGEETYPHGQGWVPTTHHLPTSVMPRPELPSGRVETVEDLLLIFYPRDRCREIPNPDPRYQPKGRKV